MTEFDTAVGGPHDGASVVTRGETLADADAALIAVHGRQATPHGILAVTESFETDAVAVLAPGAVEGDWLTTAVSEPPAAHQPALESGLRLVGRLVERAAETVGRDRTVVFGFSHGGCLVAEWVARNPDRYGGVVVLAGALIGTRTIDGTLTADDDQTPVIVGGSTADRFVPTARLRATARAFENAGGSVETMLADNAGHAITPTQLAAARGLVRAVVS